MRSGPGSLRTLRSGCLRSGSGPVRSHRGLRSGRLRPGLRYRPLQGLLLLQALPRLESPFRSPLLRRVRSLRSGRLRTCGMRSGPVRALRSGRSGLQLSFSFSRFEVGFDALKR